MKHLYRILLLIILAAPCAKAQTKVFKAVAEDMDQDFQAIFQDGKLVGYLVFTQLERASADSFNYRISIMDENLNDIGSVNFREEKLNLKGVSFDQDVLCLAYVKTNFVGKEYNKEKDFNRDINKCRAALFTQFLALNGKIIATNSVNMDIAPEYVLAANSNRHGYANGRLKHSIQLRNISGKGFTCFYGDDKKNNLVVFNTTGKLTWQKQVHEGFVDVSLLTSDADINLLIKTRDQMVEGGYAILSYNAIDSTNYPKFLLRDRRGNALKVLTFENDPISGKPYVAGLVIDSIHGNHFGYARAIKHGPYSGVFTINLNGHTRKDIQAEFSYWNNGSQTFMEKDGYLPESHEYANIERAFKDFQGNTIFAACGLTSRVRWGAITGAVLTVWSIYGAPLFLAGGTNKFATRNVLLFKQDASGQLTLATTVPTPRSAFGLATASVASYNRCGYYTVRNSDTRTEYLVIDKPKDIDIYNINQKKIARTIPHQEGNNILTVYPAKEGYVMVYDFNKKEKTTRLSIEAL